MIVDCQHDLNRMLPGYRHHAAMLSHFSFGDLYVASILASKLKLSPAGARSGATRESSSAFAFVELTGHGASSIARV
jgi:hypothetical protein